MELSIFQYLKEKVKERTSEGKSALFITNYGKIYVLGEKTDKSVVETNKDYFKFVQTYYILDEFSTLIELEKDFCEKNDLDDNKEPGMLTKYCQDFSSKIIDKFAEKIEEDHAALEISKEGNPLLYVLYRVFLDWGLKRDSGKEFYSLDDLLTKKNVKIDSIEKTYARVARKRRTGILDVLNYTPQNLKEDGIIHIPGNLTRKLRKETSKENLANCRINNSYFSIMPSEVSSDVAEALINLECEKTTEEYLKFIAIEKILPKVVELRVKNEDNDFLYWSESLKSNTYEPKGIGLGFNLFGTDEAYIYFKLGPDLGKFKFPLADWAMLVSHKSNCFFWGNEKNPDYPIFVKNWKARPKVKTDGEVYPHLGIEVGDLENKFHIKKEYVRSFVPRGSSYKSSSPEEVAKTISNLMKLAKKATENTKLIEQVRDINDPTLKSYIVGGKFDE